jgi:DNA recombination protein RmuC
VIEILLVILILAVAGLAVAVFALMKRRSGGEAEGQLRAEAAGLQAKTEELRSQLAKLEGRGRELEQQLSDEIGNRRAAEAGLAAERKNLEETRAFIEESKAKLKDAFTALSADALKDSRTQFLSQADEKLKPIQKLISDYEQHLQKIEEIRADAYGGLKGHLDSLAKAHDLLQREAHQLSTALRSPTVRGAWGQLALRNAAELAGMSRHCDFSEQVTVAAEGAVQRPDLTVHLPNHRTIVVDAKAPLDAYREAVSAGDEAARKAAMTRHAAAVRGHMRALSQKAYWSQFKDKETPDFVVLFLPGESFFSAALEEDQTLIEDGMKSGVVLASPTTLIALLRAVAYGWRQEALAENAEKIAQLGKDLHGRICNFAEYLEGIGSGLENAQKSYRKAVGSYEHMLEPGARKFVELGASSGKELPELEPGEGPMRSITPPALEAPDSPGQAPGPTT